KPADFVSFGDSKSEVRHIILHPKYNLSTNRNDIALIELTENIPFPVACLWSSRVTPLENLNTIRINYMNYDDLFEEIKIENSTLIPNKVCGKKLSWKIRKSQFCDQKCFENFDGPIFPPPQSK
uniref:Peptidase S1 domain-containing protein n=1 Tax=Megaselia scalaris TaxID=36166 RepID=T1GK95_MEGSC